MLSYRDPNSDVRPDYWLNVGGPMSRTRITRVTSSLLGQDDALIRCPRIIRLGLLFPEAVDPVTYMNELLYDLGHHTPDALRECYPSLDRPYICRAAPLNASRLDVESSHSDEVMQQALLLGQCTAHRYDPERSVFWTQASLTRALELFDPEGFYA